MVPSPAMIQSCPAWSSINRRAASRLKPCAFSNSTAAALVSGNFAIKAVTAALSFAILAVAAAPLAASISISRSAVTSLMLQGAAAGSRISSIKGAGSSPTRNLDGVKASR